MTFPFEEAYELYKLIELLKDHGGKFEILNPHEWKVSVGEICYRGYGMYGFRNAYTYLALSSDFYRRAPSNGL